MTDIHPLQELEAVRAELAECREFAWECFELGWSLHAMIGSCNDGRDVGRLFAGECMPSWASNALDAYATAGGRFMERASAISLFKQSLKKAMGEA